MKIRGLQWNKERFIRESLGAIVDGDVDAPMSKGNAPRSLLDYHWGGTLWCSSQLLCSSAELSFAQPPSD
jgi:hypothetical protein